MRRRKIVTAGTVEPGEVPPTSETVDALEAQIDLRLREYANRLHEFPRAMAEALEPLLTGHRHSIHVSAEKDGWRGVEVDGELVSRMLPVDTLKLGFTFEVAP